MDKFLLKQKIENGSIVNLNNQTMSMILVCLIIVLAITGLPVCFKVFPSEGFYFLAYLSLGLIAVIIFYILIYGGSARLIENHVYIDKIIGKKFKVEIRTLEGVSSFSIGTIKFTTIRFPYEDITDKVIIINTRNRFQKFELNPEELIEYAQSIQNEGN